jgi:hypothetical protein
VDVFSVTVLLGGSTGGPSTKFNTAPSALIITEPIRLISVAGLGVPTAEVVGLDAAGVIVGLAVAAAALVIELGTTAGAAVTLDGSEAEVGFTAGDAAAGMMCVFADCGACEPDVLVGDVRPVAAFRVAAAAVRAETAATCAERACWFAIVWPVRADVGDSVSVCSDVFAALDFWCSAEGACGAGGFGALVCEEPVLAAATPAARIAAGPRHARVRTASSHTRS